MEAKQLIIDAHAHGWPSKSILSAEYEKIVDEWKTTYFEFYKKMAWMKTAGLGTAVELVERGLVENLVKAMNQCGVDKAIIADMYPYPFEWKVEMKKKISRQAVHLCLRRSEEWKSSDTGTRNTNSKI